MKLCQNDLFYYVELGLKRLLDRINEYGLTLLNSKDHFPGPFYYVQTPFRQI